MKTANMKHNNGKSWKHASKNRHQWSGSRRSTNKLDLAIAAEQAELREFEELLWYEYATMGLNEDDVEVTPEKPEISDAEIAYWINIFQCA